MSVRRLIAAVGGLVTLMAAAPLTAVHGQGQISQLAQDSKLIFELASSNIMETRLGQLAQQKAINPSVKQFGQRMVADHTTLQNRLTTVVSRNNTQFKPGMTDKDENEVERLEKISGAEFDRAYMTSIIQHHQEDIALLQSSGQSARSAEAREIVGASLPILQQHLSMATQVGNQIGVTTTTAAGPTPNPPVATQNPPVTNPPVTNQSPQSTQAAVAADLPFLRQAASSNLMEIRLGQVAQNKATNDAVKQFGQRMVTDHTQMQSQLTSVASVSGQTFTPSMDSQHQQEVNRVERLSGAEFDRAYMSLMIRGHQNDLNQFQTQSQSARSNDVRSLASTSLPVLQQHLSLAVQVGGQVGADTTTNVAGPNRPGQGNQGNVRADAEFIRDVGAGTTLQIQLAELAQKDAKDRDVRRLAERLKDDYTRLQEQWIDMASRNGMSLKSGMGPLHREKVEQLENARGKNFDRTYMTLMVQHHHDMVSYWQKEGRASRATQVRQLVNRGLPTLEQNQAQVRQVARQVGVNPEQALRNRTDISRGKDKDKSAR